jgi:hypothetical protein
MYDLDTCVKREYEQLVASAENGCLIRDGMFAFVEDIDGKYVESIRASIASSTAANNV